MAVSGKKQMSFLAGQRNLLDIIEEKQMVLNLDIANAVRRTIYEMIKGSSMSTKTGSYRGKVLFIKG